MLRIRLFLPDPVNHRSRRGECACCSGRYSVKRLGMRLFDGDRLEGEICPECVLTGPAGAAGKIRGRLGAMAGKDPSSRGRRGGASWERMLSRRARLLEGTPSFSLAARQAAVRETRERR